MPMFTLFAHRRIPFLALFAVCTALLGFGLYLQHAVGLEPCPMCIMQRYAFAAVALIALIAGMQGPNLIGRRVYAVLILLTALTGAGIAIRQSWIQRYPPAFAECGPDLEFMLDSFPLAEALPKIFSGTGDCSAIEWTFLGLSIANWSLLWFSATAVFAGYLLLRGKRT